MPCKKYNTPHRSRVVKTRMTEEEYAILYSIWFVKSTSQCNLEVLS